MILIQADRSMAWATLPEPWSNSAPMRARNLSRAGFRRSTSGDMWVTVPTLSVKIWFGLRISHIPSPILLQAQSDDALSFVLFVRASLCGRLAFWRGRSCLLCIFHALALLLVSSPHACMAPVGLLNLGEPRARKKQHTHTCLTNTRFLSSCSYDRN